MQHSAGGRHISARSQALKYLIMRVTHACALSCGRAVQFHGWTDCEGRIENVVSKDELLTNISVCLRLAVKLMPRGHAVRAAHAHRGHAVRK